MVHRPLVFAALAILVLMPTTIINANMLVPKTSISDDVSPHLCTKMRRAHKDMSLYPIPEEKEHFIYQMRERLKSLKLRGDRERRTIKFPHESSKSPWNPEPKPLTPGPNDWVVTDHEVHEDEIIILTGNLIVQAGGELTLINCTLYINCTYNGEWQIRIEDGGTMNVLDGSNITAYREEAPGYRFLFYVYGKLTVRDSFLSECGYDYNHPGLWLQTDEGALLENTTITNFLCVYCYEAFNVTITNCTISQSYSPLDWPYTGIACRNSSNMTITNCEIRQNGVGIYCWRSSNITITNCVISESNEPGIYCGCSSDITITCCEIKEGPDGIWIDDESSDITIRSCEIEHNCYRGIYIEDSSNIAILSCTISRNREEGIYCYYSSSITIMNCTIRYLKHSNCAKK